MLSHAEARLPEHRYFFLDCPSERISHQDLRRVVSRIQPHLVGISSYTISIIDALRVADTIRETSPGAHVCLGGPHPTAYPHEAASLPGVDSIIAGEGEQAFTRLVEHLAEGRDFSEIECLYTRHTIEQRQGVDSGSCGRFLSRPALKFGYVEDLDELPPPNREHISHTTHYSIVGAGRKLATMLSSRGCPYNCTFCDNPYRQYRDRDMDAVISEIRDCIANGYREIHFYDELFNITDEKLLDFSRALLKENIDITWDFRGRVDALTHESLALARRAGLRMISLGVETGSDEGLGRLRKGFDVAQVEQAFEWCRRLGIKTVAYFMIGLPHERSKKDVRDSVDFLIRLDPDYAMISILNLYPHTALTHEAMERGLLPRNYWEDFARAPDTTFKVPHWNEFLSTGDLVELHRESYRRFYLRAPYVLRSVYSIRSAHEFMSKIRGVLKLLR